MGFILGFFGYRRLLILIAAMLLGAVLDLAGIALLFPFIKLVSDPARQVERFHLQPWLERLHLGTSQALVLAVGVGLIGFYTLKAVFLYLLNRYQNKSAANLTFRLTEEMYRRLLNCRYAAFQQFPGSQLIYVIYNYPAHATLCVSAIAAICNDALFLGLFLLASLGISPLGTLGVLLIFMIIGACLQLTVVRWTHAIGKRQSRFEDAKHKLAFATITAIKDIKVMGIEEHIRAENTAISKQFQETAWKFNLLGSLPKNLIEYLIFVLLCLGILVYLGRQRDTANLLPLIGVGIAAVMRIVPSFTRLIGSLNTFKFYRPGIDKIIDFYGKTRDFEVSVDDCPLPFQRMFEAKSLGFSYGDKVILSDVSLSIPKGHSIGIVGLSGSGKSTLLDLISGIQEKAEGEFLLDGVPVDPFRTNAIRRMLGYVAQNISLVDESIAFNVSFSRDWDPKRLHRALKVANLLEFVDQQPEKERTTVGENGIRLSGGQRQRIGIARALYKDPEILIFDEATSAVDNITEQELTREIKGLAGTKTLIMVAHRLSTIMHCDCIYILGGGRVLGKGTYQELLAENRFFQELSRQQAVEKQ